MNLNNTLICLIIAILSLYLYEQKQTNQSIKELKGEIQTLSQNKIHDGGYIKTPAPAYPASAREREEEGTVKIEIIVSPNGTTESVAVIQSSGSPRLDHAARTAAEKTQYRPKTQNNVPMRTRFVAWYTFKLDD